MSKNEQILQDEKETSARILGLWALVLFICGVVGLFAEEVVYFYSSMVWVLVWLSGCDRRGSNFVPASFEGQRNLVHYAFMLCVAGILIGIAVGMNRILKGAFFGLSAIMFMLSWDLILYDTKKSTMRRNPNILHKPKITMQT